MLRRLASARATSWMRAAACVFGTVPSRRRRRNCARSRSCVAPCRLGLYRVGDLRSVNAVAAARNRDAPSEGQRCLPRHRQRVRRRLRPVLDIAVRVQPICLNQQCRMSGTTFPRAQSSQPLTSSHQPDTQPHRLSSPSPNATHERRRCASPSLWPACRRLIATPLAPHPPALTRHTRASYRPTRRHQASPSRSRAIGWRTQGWCA
jgi:hypothetical protein